MSWHGHIDRTGDCYQYNAMFFSAVLVRVDSASREYYSAISPACSNASCGDTYVAYFPSRIHDTRGGIVVGGQAMRISFYEV